MSADGVVGGPGQYPRIRGILNDWATKHGVQFVWKPDLAITYTKSRGAWHLSTSAINERDDRVYVHPVSDDEVLIQRCADVGHIEVLRLDAKGLSEELGQSLDWFQGWEDFFSCGPGPGH